MNNYDINRPMANSNINNLAGLYTGYIQGNMFNNLYDQYKNYQPETLRASNEQERLFLELSRNHFAAHELNLYLDLNPNDISMLKL